MATVNPAVLTWARKQSGNITVDDVARKLKIPAERVSEWENGISFPSWSQLSSLAKWYRLPTVYFYMDAPPSDAHSPPDFRSSPGDEQERRPWLAAELRRLHNVRDLAIELRESLGRNPDTFGASISLEMDVEHAATLIVDALKRRTAVPEPGGERRANPNWWYARWRRALEDTDIIVMQMRERVAVAEFRGLSISYPVAPAILVNPRDAISGRLFTMLHEVAHIALNRDGICSPQYGTEDSGKEIERFCNRVAAEVLIPRSVFSAPMARSLDTDPVAASATIAALTGASREAALVRSVELGLLNRQRYYKAVEQVRGTYEENVRRTGGPRRDRLAMSRVGYAFGGLVFEALAAEKITAIEASRYLDNLPVGYLTAAEAVVRQHFEVSHE